ncbi:MULTISPECIES: diguanylate cyclase [unclassified Cupriavidus]|uniref:diguanylate cyclase n=1 Tax=unclassified Cupriavidus TaxID=2640874 RepID=UPI0009F19CAC|nr:MULTISPECIES: diguanylate cyclase [unclassified Cupriavidus]
MQPDPAYRQPSTAQHPRLAMLLTAIGTLAFGAGSIAVSRNPGEPATIWLASAFALGLLLRRPRAETRGLLASVLAGILLANWLMGDSFGAALLLAGANTAEIGLSAWLARQLLASTRQASTGPLAGFAIVMGTGSTIGPAVGATLGAAVISTVYQGLYTSAWWTWWTSDALGAVLLLPLMATLTRERILTTLAPRRRWRLAGLSLLCLATSCATVWLGHEHFIVLSMPLLLTALGSNPLVTALLALLSVTVTVLLDLYSAHAGWHAAPTALLQSGQISAALIVIFPICIAFVVEQNRHDRNELRGSEQRFRQAMEHSAIGMALVSLDGRWHTVNRAICELFGYSADEMAELPFQTITHPDDLASDLRQLEQLLTGEIESYRMEKRYLRKNGEYVWALLAVSLMHDEASGEPLHFIAQVESIHERKTAQEALERLSRRTQLAVEAGGVGIWEWDFVTSTITWDARMHALHGLPAREADGSGVLALEQWIAMLHPDDLQRASDEMRHAIKGTRPFDTEYRIRLPGGEVRHIRAMAMVSRQQDGRASAMVGTNWDITEQRHLTEALFEEKERLHITLRSIGDAVICTDAQMGVTFMNPIAEQLTGWTLPAAMGQPLEQIFRVVDENSGDVIPNPVATCLQTLRPVYLQDGAVLLGLNGDRHDVQDSAAPVLTAAGEVLGAVLVFQDITQARALQRELAHSATHDALTGLPNRNWFEKRLREACDAARQQLQRHALCFIDLDRFKIVNDTAGHAAGDVLLRELSHVIRHHVRTDDVLARLGGDEFGLLLHNCTVEHAEAVCQKVIDAIRGQRFPWEGRVYDLGASIGITAIDAEAPPVGELMSRADVACYAAKAAGRNRVSVYRSDESDAQRHHQELQVAAGIHSALEANRFRLFAQEIRPLQVACADAHHIEILVRMIDEGGQLVMPGAFIPAAERYDLMGHVDRWVIRHVLRSYGARLLAVPGLTVGINLSANSLGEPFLLPFLHAELHDSVLPASRIQLEITETALINNMAAANRLVSEMRRAGCTVALDDFGTGLSSFAYLKQFPVDCLKIDGSFIRHLASNAVDREIVSSINDIGHRLGVSTVAESVEDEQTLHVLRTIGVDFAQGYVIGRPMPLDLFLDSRTARASQDS